MTTCEVCKQPEDDCVCCADCLRQIEDHCEECQECHCDGSCTEESYDDV